LNGRSISSHEKKYKNNEFGTVVVQITVNRNGNVIAAKYTKGTTTQTMPCGTSIGNTNGKPECSETQIGFITVNFKLGE
jgi:hypothetical protein